MSKNLEASIKKITDKGFSKSKAQKALKDCNNNVQQALKLLENQAAQAEKEAKAEELLRQKEFERREKEERRAFRRAQGLPDSDEEREMMAAENQKIKLHPCIQQYGNCRFGKFCHFKYLPGDTCINYLLGNCIYDIKCANRHSYEGEDLRKYVKDMQSEALVYEDNHGTYYGVDPNSKGKVVAAEYYVEAYDPSDAWAAPAPLPSAFDAADGAEPTYTEPANQESIWEDDYASNSEPAPQPFLERLKKGLETKIAEKSALKMNASSWVPLSQKKPPAPKVTVVGGGTLCPKTRFAPVTKAKHPCIYQMGSCKFGDLCAHKDEPADACVFFLNGKCRLPDDECEYRHVRRNCGGDLVLTEEELMMIHGRPAGGAGSRISAMLSKKMGADAIPPLAHSAGTTPAEDALFEIQSETEEESFYFLKEAFPGKEDLDILQALRLGGSRAAAIDLLFEFEDVDKLDAARVERQLQEQEALEEIAQAERTERLLTLCQLFPKLEVGVIESALEASDGGFDKTFRDLQCRVEHIVQTERKNQWGTKTTVAGTAFAAKGVAPTAADKLKLDRLYAMFPDLPREVIDDVFAECGTVPLSIDTLRILTHDLSSISDADREEAGKLRMHYTAPPTVTSASASSSTQHVASGSSFSVRAGGQEPMKTSFISDSDFYKKIIESADGKEDWRRLRQEAAMINSARIQCISLAAHAYSTGNGKGAQSLGSRARQLGILYEKTNILAMHALEVEGKMTGVSVLDLHGFRKEEALDVLKRRLELCARRKCRKLRVIVGRGTHSAQGRAVLYPLIVDHMKHVEPFCSLGSIFSSTESHIDVDVHA